MSGLIQETRLFGENNPRLEGMREKGRAAFYMPTPKTEAWKYTRLYALKADDFVVLPSKFLEEEQAEKQECHCGGHHCCSSHECHCDGGHKCSCPKQNKVPFEAYQLHFENGKFVPHYPDMPDGVEIMTLMQAFVEGEEDHLLGKNLDLSAFPFAALNTAYLEEGLFIRVAKNTHLSQPIALINHTECTGKNILSNLRNLIVIEEGASAEILEYYDYCGEQKSRYFNNIVNDIYVGKDAVLKYYKLQDEAFKAVHIALNNVQVKGGGLFNSFCLQKGADLGRCETRVKLVEPYAKAEVNAAYIMNGWATLDTTTDIDHMAEKTHSLQLIKGVIGGEAKGVFQGKIHIEQDAQETEGYQLHKALLLSDTAEIDVKPALEIYADNVKCSHGAACGELDKEQLFYMRSRGIGEEEARQILIEAYLNDVIARVENPQIREWYYGLI